MRAKPRLLRVAILDLNNGHPNQGMRCLRDILHAADTQNDDVDVVWDEFDVRQRGEVPGLDYDVYLSSGGPGSPYEGEGQPWEDDYFRWMGAVFAHNEACPEAPKRVFFICHSLQMAVRFTGVAAVTERRSESFGIFPVYMTDAGRADAVFRGLADPFFGADFRSWQIVQPDAARMKALGAEVLAREKIRPHVALERAIMAIRFTPHIVGTQFHPEADPGGMLVHFRHEERKTLIIQRHGLEKYERIIHRMAHPDYLARTHLAILPHFLRDSMDVCARRVQRKAA